MVSVWHIVRSSTEFFVFIVILYLIWDCVKRHVVRFYCAFPSRKFCCSIIKFSLYTWYNIFGSSPTFREVLRPLPKRDFPFPHSQEYRSPLHRRLKSLFFWLIIILYNLYSLHSFSRRIWHSVFGVQIYPDFKCSWCRFLDTRGVVGSVTGCTSVHSDYRTQDSYSSFRGSPIHPVLVSSEKTGFIQSHLRYRPWTISFPNLLFPLRVGYSP